MPAPAKLPAGHLLALCDHLGDGTSNDGRPFWVSGRWEIQAGHVVGSVALEGEHRRLYASPGWEGHPGIPVALDATDGDVVVVSLHPAWTGYLDTDAQLYVATMEAFLGRLFAPGVEGERLATLAIDFLAEWRRTHATPFAIDTETARPVDEDPAAMALYRFVGIEDPDGEVEVPRVAALIALLQDPEGES